MTGWKFVLLFVGAMVLMLLLLCQDAGKNPPPPAPAPAGKELLPGEYEDPNWPKPIVAWVRDNTCTETDKCPPTDEDCSHKNFTVQIDTMYHLTVIFFNSDTLAPSCRTCGTIYDDRRVVENVVTACPTGGQWEAHMRLVPGVTYTLEACLQSCPETPACKCGGLFNADAVVSLRRLFD